MTAFTASSANSSQSVADCAGSSQARALSDLPTSCQNSQSCNRLVPSKGRFASKLSSRHNRRKRRDRENKDPSAKKSCGGKKYRDRIAIPSFTPITEDCRPEESLKASSLTGPNEGSDTTKPIANTAAFKADTFANDNSTNQTNESRKRNSNQSADPLTNGQVYSSAPTQKKQQNTYSKIERRATETKQNRSSVNCRDSPAEKSSKDPQHMTIPKKLPGEPIELIFGRPTLASLEAVPVQEHPPAQVADKYSSSSHSLPSSAEMSKMINSHRGSISRPEKNYEKGDAEVTVKRFPEATDDQPQNEISGDKFEASKSKVDPSKEIKSDLERQASPASLHKTEKNQKLSIERIGANSHNISKCIGSAESTIPEDNNPVEGKETEIDKVPCLPNGRVEKAPMWILPKENDVHLEVGVLPTNSSAKQGDSFRLNESGSSQLTRQAESKLKMPRDIDNKDEVIDNVSAKKNKSSPSVGSTKPAPLEVIEIIDDGDGDNDVIIPKTKTKQAPRKSAADKKIRALGKKRKLKQSPPRKRRKKTVNISRGSSGSSSGDEIAHDAKKFNKTHDEKSSTKRRNRTVKIDESKAAKQSKKSSGSKMCFACSTCKCNSRSGSAATPQKSSSLSGSDASQEQSLVNRLQRFERDIAWKEGQRNDVARELKKRRGQMLKKWEAQSSNSKAQRPRFLADAEVSEALGDPSSKMSSKEINRARSRIFGQPKKHQPTLTQIIRGPKDDEDDEKPSELDYHRNNAISNCDENGPGKADGTSPPDGDSDFLAFWDGSVPTDRSDQCLGSMSYFNRAFAKSKEIKSTGNWAKATANALQIEEEEGFDALVDLFDASMEKNALDGCADCSQNSIDDDDVDHESSIFPPLTPERRRVAKDIQTSVEDDPHKLAAIERMCPNWKENIQFAQAMDPNNLYNALQNVQQANADLENMKEKILQAFLDRQHTLNLYEISLRRSLLDQTKQR